MSHSYLKPGFYNATLTVFDNYGDSDFELFELMMEMERRYHCVMDEDSLSDLLSENRTWDDVTLIEFIRYIIKTSSLNEILGDHPNFSLALDGSPSRVSTSVGRK